MADGALICRIDQCVRVGRWLAIKAGLIEVIEEIGLM